MISVGRAGCIRSNIMQAYTGSLLECVRSLGSCPPSPLSSPPRGRSAARYTAYTQNIRPRVRENGSGSSGFSLRTCVGLRFSRAARARARVSSLPTCERARVYVCVRVYTTYPTCIEIAGALNPGSGHEIVIPERLTLLPHLAGPRGRA